MNEPAVVATPPYSALQTAQINAVGAVWVQRRPWVKGPYALLQLVVFALAGFPPERLAIVATLQLAHWFYWIYLAKRAREGRRIHSVYTTHLIAMSVVTTVLALSGGLGSPLAPALLGLPTGTLVTYGRSRETWVTLGLAALSVLVLGLSPLVIPAVPLHAPYSTLLTALALLFAIGILGTIILALTDAYRHAGERLDHLREELLTDLRCRTRSLESIGAKVAHELKNPLASIKALVQLGARDAASARAAERVAVVEREIERMEGILRDYLSFARPLEKLRPEVVDLGALADGVLAVLEARAAAAGVALRRAGSGARVVGDPLRLKAALLNLAANALEATPPGGMVTVVVRACEGGAALEVVDTGRGIPREQLARVGTPFFTTRTGGTGLGVALARSAVVQHGGALDIASTPGEGTTVTVQLPARGREDDGGAWPSAVGG